MRISIPRINRPHFLAALASCFSFALIRADEPGGFDASDLVQLRAKAALEKDPSFHGLNLLVSVRDGVVLVNGGVPDEATAEKIEAVLAKVPGISIVRVTTWPATTTDPIKKLIADRLGDSGTVTPSAGRLVPNLAVNPVLPAMVSTLIPALPDGIGAAPVSDPRPDGMVVAQRLDPTPLLGMLQSPIISGNGSPRLPTGIEIPPVPFGPVGYPTIRPTRLPVAQAEAPPADMALTLLEIRRANPRYSDLTAEVRTGTATINGSAASMTDAHDFAAEIAKVAGIERVTIGSVQIR